MNKPHFDFRGNYEKYLPGVPQFLILTKVLHTDVMLDELLVADGAPVPSVLLGVLGMMFQEEQPPNKFKRIREMVS